MSNINLKAPISPQEAGSLAITNIPEEIFEAINTILIERTGPQTKEVTIKQDEILDRYFKICKEKEITPHSRQSIFDKKYLDIEALYQKAGWGVEYDKPAYCENYDAYFKFKPKKK